jgi:hypothetical protein
MTIEGLGSECVRWRIASNQPQPLQACVPLLADDDVVVHGDTERLRHIDDLLGHLDVCA